MAQSRRWLALSLPVAIVLVFAALTASLRVSAQQEANHPAHIHSGTCDNLGGIVVPLNNVAFAEAAQLEGTAGAIPVKVSDTQVDMSLADILASEHSINVHESPDNVQEYIACGEIGGPVRGDVLIIGLGALNVSDHRGVAILEDTDDGTHVTVYLTEGAAGEVVEATPDDEVEVEEAVDEEVTEEAEDEAEAEEAVDEADDDDAVDVPAGQEVAVDIRDFAFNPDPIEISVGDTVTWTNQDGVPHTATGQNRDALQSGTISPGSSFSQTFTEAGEVPYFCEFHPNMNGTVIVE